MIKAGTHKLFEIKLSKDNGEHWYHYLYVGGYYRIHETDESIIKHISKQHEFLRHDNTLMKVIRYG